MSQAISVVAESLRRFIHDQPVSFLLFVLGAALLLLGLTNGVNWLTPYQQLRFVALGLGVAAVVASVLLGILIPKGLDGGSLSALDGEPLSAKLTYLTRTQRKVLTVIEESTASRTLVVQQKLQSVLAMQASELFYRLEQLRLLGFIERQQLGLESQAAYGYRLSADYNRLRGRTDDTTQPSPTAEDSE